MLRPLASYTHTPVPIACVHTSTLVLLPRLLLFVYVYHTYLYTYIVCALVYHTVHAPYHTILYHSIGTLPHLLHIYMCAPKYISIPYSYKYKHNMPLCMSSSHPLHIRYTSGTGYMAYAITRSVAYNATLPRI